MGKKYRYGGQVRDMARAQEEAVVSLQELISETPMACSEERASKLVDEFRELARAQSKNGLTEALSDSGAAKLIGTVCCGSPYLAGLMRADLDRLGRVLKSNPDVLFQDLQASLVEQVSSVVTIEDLMRLLRLFKSEVALLCALADLSGVWSVQRLTEVLSQTADVAIQSSVGFLMKEAVTRGDWIGVENGEKPEAHSGYIVLAMGKYGARELNYSSDIDLIVLFEHEKVRLREGLEAPTFFVRMTRDLVRLLDERTADGYVFRTDLRLRPDPGATQVALSTDAAMVYYESFGQNWERAVLIKARPVAGDIEAGNAFLRELEPFVWRKYLDFAAIADLHSMKRRIHAFRGFGEIGVAGHNIKLGRGGIREVEFFAQTQQLIAGGRQPQLRTRQTLVTLDRLVEYDWITNEVRDDLRQAYLFLRRIEHRLQMIGDDQTHEIPSDPGQLENVARFCGYQDRKAFSDALVPVLKCVQKHYAELFEELPEADGVSANLVFTGQDDEPETIEALQKLGYSNPQTVMATVRSWHHGRHAVVRSPVSRERLSAVLPLLIEALADTPDPDTALQTFDRFLSELPTGVQLFSLLRARPGLLRLVADIMGTAPRLARILSRRGRLLDAVIDPGTFVTLPSADSFEDLLRTEAGKAENFEDMLNQLRVVGSEQSFLLGVRVLSGSINAAQAGEGYAVLAERLIGVMQQRVTRELEQVHGSISGGSASIIAMGKLGGRELTASSDIDLIVVYDFDEDQVSSDGSRPLAPQQYFFRLTQRLITALSAPTAEGSLYDVDMRLRPSGQQGPVATQFKSFLRYQAEEAWTWEHMALTRGRVLTGDPGLRRRVEEAIVSALTKPRDQKKTAQDVLEMRERISAEKGTDNIWDLKQVRGGLVDLEFIAQYLQLVHAHKQPEILDQNTLRAYEKLRRAGILDASQADVLIPATRLLLNLTQVLRICISEDFKPDSASKALRDLLARAGQCPDFGSLELLLRETLSKVHREFERAFA